MPLRSNAYLCPAANRDHNRDPNPDQRMKRLVGTGISSTELACNDQLSSFAQADLNAKPTLPFADGSFDVVTCVVSFDYLTKPRDVLREVARVLRPGGKLLLSQSNRCFFTKACMCTTACACALLHVHVHCCMCMCTAACACALLHVHRHCCMCTAA